MMPGNGAHFLTASPVYRSTLPPALGMKSIQNTCIDTNIWIYALTSPRHGDDFRHKKSQAIITRSEPILITLTIRPSPLTDEIPF